MNDQQKAAVVEAAKKHEIMLFKKPKQRRAPRDDEAEYVVELAQAAVKLGIHSEAVADVLQAAGVEYKAPGGLTRLDVPAP